jgi:hypothetical protein
MSATSLKIKACEGNQYFIETISTVENGQTHPLGDWRITKRNQYSKQTLRRN